MRRNFPVSLLLVMAMAGLATAAHAAPDARAEREIRQLLEFVADSGCTFVRNGDAHDARAAADHLAMKYGKARSRLSTPEEFIEHIAARSYFSGREYRVRCSGKAEQASARWLGDELKARRSSVTAAVSPTPRAPRVPD